VRELLRRLRTIAAAWNGKSLVELPEVVSYSLPECDLGPLGGYEELHRFALTQRQLFQRLEPMPGWPSGLRKLSTADIRIRIVTHRFFIKYFHKEAIEQTVAWLDVHGIHYWDLCFMRDKARRSEPVCRRHSLGRGSDAECGPANPCVHKFDQSRPAQSRLAGRSRRVCPQGT
jgi:hypothetical protein